MTEQIRLRIPVHNHSVSGFNRENPRGPGDCAACDHIREAWQQAEQEGR